MCLAVTWNLDLRTPLLFLWLFFHADQFLVKVNTLGYVPDSSRRPKLPAIADPAATKQSERTDDTLVVKQDHLTAYADDVGVVPAGVERSTFSVVPPLDPYPPAEINSALTRSYEIDNFTWATTDAPGAKVFEVEFPFALFTKPYIYDKLKDYLYFRSRVEVTFRLNTTKFEFGTLLVSWLPFYKQSGSTIGSWRMNNIASCAQCNPVLISAQQGTTVTVDMPWIHPEPWMPINSGLPEIGTMVVRVLHRLSSASVDPPADITVNVYARFIEPTVAGYAPDANPTSTVLARNVTQSANTSLGIDTSKITRKDVREVYAARPKGPTMQQEAKAKSSSGVISSAIKGVASYAPMVAMADPGLLPVALMGQFLAETIGPVFSAIGLNKPTDISTAGKSIATLGNGLLHGEGLDYPTKLSLDPECSIATTVGLCGYDNPQPTISEIIMRPSLVDTFQFDTSTPKGSKIYNVPLMPLGYVVNSDSEQNVVVPTYAAYYANWHQYWRGGFKFKFRFTTSSFVTTRVRITFQPEEITSNISDVSGDLISRVVDVTGDTDCEMFFPYISNHWYLPVHMPHTTDWQDSRYSFGRLIIYLDAPVVSVDTVAQPPVFCSVWQAAAEDFRFMQYTNPIIPPNAIRFDTTIPALAKSKGKARNVTQCDITREFSKPFKGIVEPAMLSPEAALVNGEDSSTLAQLIHRYVPYGFQPIAGSSELYPNVPTYDSHYMLISPFLNYRGGKRFFLVKGNTDSVSPVGYKYSGLDPEPMPRYTSHLMAGIAYGGAYTAPLAFETAWYEPYLFKETWPTIDLNPGFQRVEIGRDEASGVLLHSYNDDFSVGVLCATPMFVYPVENPPDSETTIRKRFGWRTKLAPSRR